MKTAHALIVALLALGFLAITGCKDSNSLVDPSGTASYDKLAAYTVFDNTNIDPVDLSELTCTIDQKTGVYVLGAPDNDQDENDNDFDEQGRMGDGPHGNGQMGDGPHGNGQMGDGQHGNGQMGDGQHGQNGPDDHGKGPHGKGLRIRDLGRIFKELNLTPAQDSAVRLCAKDFNACARSAKATYDTARRALYTELHTAMKSLRQQVLDSTITKDSAKAQAHLLFDAYKAAVKSLEDTLKASLDNCWKAFMDCVKGTLTDEQYLKLQDLLKR